ncbi:MAG: AmmeMemoRadiSam system radical SAM enzyme [Candidatus Omnitrophota bacterium]|nr:AmmeMemoRadiSam system radical SAM enzyme [Candidatus Omnitrophota bacterium]MDZ4242578.1 AmmeMemoRadiSam system radical SAM enzyme [Candidatus Omnitrophota bacterium]
MTSPIVECTLCPRRCRLRNGERGDCRVRLNLDGKLYSLVFGNPCSVHVDPVEKKPMYHVLPASSSFSLATAGCNLHCKYCQNWEISQVPPEETENYNLTPEQIVQAALNERCRSIAYTYSDPVVFYEYTLATSRLAKEKGLINIFRTAAYIEPEPLEELCAYVQTASVDLKGITEEFYKKICAGTLAPVLKALKIMKKNGVWIEITNLVVPTWNDSAEDIRGLSRWVLDNLGPDTPIHFSRFWPMHQLQNLPPTPVRTLAAAYDIAKKEGLRYVYIGNVPEHIGNNTVCPTDGKTLIRRVGYSILENHIVNGACEYCGTKIPGIWS